MTLWAKSKSCATLYQHYFAEVIRTGRLTIHSSKADSLAHTLRAVLKGFHERQEAPYSALFGHIKIMVKEGSVIMEKVMGSPSVDPISEREYRVLAPVKFSMVLSSVASMIDGKVNKVAFLNVEDLTNENKSILEALCKEKSFVYNFTETQVVIVK